MTDPAAPNEWWNGYDAESAAKAQREIDEYFASIKATLPPGTKLYFESHNETLRGEEAFEALFGWGDHQCLRDALAMPKPQLPFRPYGARVG